MSQQVKLRYIGEGLLIYAKLLKLEVIIVLNCHYTLQESYITFIWLALTIFLIFEACICDYWEHDLKFPTNTLHFQALALYLSA